MRLLPSLLPRLHMPRCFRRLQSRQRMCRWPRAFRCPHRRRRRRGCRRRIRLPVLRPARRPGRGARPLGRKPRRPPPRPPAVAALMMPARRPAARIGPWRPRLLPPSGDFVLFVHHYWASKALSRRTTPLLRTNYLETLLGLRRRVTRLHRFTVGFISPLARSCRRMCWLTLASLVTPSSTNTRVLLSYMSWARACGSPVGRPSRCKPRFEPPT